MVWRYCRCFSFENISPLLNDSDFSSSFPLPLPSSFPLPLPPSFSRSSDCSRGYIFGF